MEAEIKCRWPDAEVNLIPGGKGVFDVTLQGAPQGQLVYSKYKTGRHAEPGEVVRLLEPLAEGEA